MAANPPKGPEVIGKWDDKFPLSNVAIHAHLLRTGEVLYWGRRAHPGAVDFDSLNEHSCSTFLWNPNDGSDLPTTNQPTLEGGQTVNLFCSGHSFLPDGRLLVVGGHLFDREGVDQACIYDPAGKTWKPEARMNAGRWYPSAITLPDGDVLAISGSFATGRPQPLGVPPDTTSAPDDKTNFAVNLNPQIWRNQNWVRVTDFDDQPLYPRLHIDPKQGDVFVAGPRGQSSSLDVGTNIWSNGSAREGQLREYAPSVMYDSGKIIFIGGGLNNGTQVPTDIAEVINLNDAAPTWVTTDLMKIRRRQHNATVLPDGTVLVTGGTRNLDNQPRDDWHIFDKLRANAPVHEAELWDSETGKWTLMAAESVDRCYHSTALLLPDGRVLSAGGGEYDPKDPDNPRKPNPTADSHSDAQLFSPPYLCKGGPRPTIKTVQSEIDYAEKFDVVVGDTDTINRVSWIRLGSVTHSCNMNQSCIFLDSDQLGRDLTVTAPLNANIAPPGHYLLFVLNELGIPSEGKIIRIKLLDGHIFRMQRIAVPEPTPVDIVKRDDKITAGEGPPIVIGITPSCPYGLGACWGGAFGGLQKLKDIKIVRSVPDTANSLAFVYLEDGKLPDIDIWKEQFVKTVNGTFTIRGIEMTVSGVVTENSGKLMLTDKSTGTEFVLAPLKAADKVQWDMTTRANRLVSPEEGSKFEQFSKDIAETLAGVTVHVTGPLIKNEDDFTVQVRDYGKAGSGTSGRP